MTNTLEKAVAALSEGGYTLSLINGDQAFTSDKRGIAPLLMLTQASPGLLSGASVADKVTGKASAMLMIRGRVKELHTRVISRPALEALEASAVEVYYDEVTPQIRNRAGDGICPMEGAVMFVDEPERAYAVICETYSKLIQG